MKKTMLLIVVVGIAIFAAYRSTFSATVRYRLTLQADVNGESKSGSGVIEVTYSKNNDPISHADFSIEVRGEAVTLDLGSYGPLFALLAAGSDNRSGPEYIVLRAFNFPGGALPSPTVSGLQQVRQLSGKRELPLTGLPLLVRFGDIADPATVKQVDALRLDESFGTGVKLISAGIEIVPAGIWPFNRFGITGQPISSGIEHRLTWLPKYRDLRLDGQRYLTVHSLRPFANSLSAGDFKVGFKQ